MGKPLASAQAELFTYGVAPGVYEYRFSGPGQVQADQAPMGRQLEAVLSLMRDGRWRTLREICDAIDNIGDPQSISARLRDLRKERFGSWTVDRRIRAGTSRVREYRVRE